MASSNPLQMEYTLWYIDVESSEDFDEKTGFWMYYKVIRCSDGAVWPDEILMEQYYKGEKVSEHKILVAHMDEILKVCNKMKEHLDELSPINHKITSSYMGEQYNNQEMNMKPENLANYWGLAMEYAETKYKMEIGDHISKYEKQEEIKEAYEAGFLKAVELFNTTMTSNSKNQ
jgi:hypothetical protein